MVAWPGGRAVQGRNVPTVDGVWKQMSRIQGQREHGMGAKAGRRASDQVLALGSTCRMRLPFGGVWVSWESSRSERQWASQSGQVVPGARESPQRRPVVTRVGESDIRASRKGCNPGTAGSTYRHPLHLQVPAPPGGRNHHRGVGTALFVMRILKNCNSMCFTFINGSNWFLNSK